LINYCAENSRTTDNILSTINLVLCTHSFFFLSLSKLNFNTAFPPMPVPLTLLLTFKFSNWNGACFCYFFPPASYKLLPTRCKIPGDMHSKYPNSANFKSLITSTYARSLALCGKSFKLNFVTSDDCLLHNSVISTNLCHMNYTILRHIPFCHVVLPFKQTVTIHLHILSFLSTETQAIRRHFTYTAIIFLNLINLHEIISK